MKTTLNAIRAHHPCSGGWTKLLRTLNKTQADDELVTILQILDSNGLNDALWCLRAVEGRDKEIQKYAVWCARQVQHLMTDHRSIAALDVAERFADGTASEKELIEASERGERARRRRRRRPKNPNFAVFAFLFPPLNRPPIMTTIITPRLQHAFDYISHEAMCFHPDGPDHLARDFHSMLQRDVPEIDIVQALLTVPATIMKAERLSAALSRIINALDTPTDGH